MRLIDGDKIAELAESYYKTWNRAISFADSKDKVERAEQMKEVCKIIEAIARHCQTIEPVKHGHWIVYEGQSNIRVACSECEHPVNYFWDDWKSANYCPLCGAKMDEKPGGDKVDEKEEQKE